MLELAAGTVLGGTWKLARPLGEGGMGAVWVAEHARLPKKFAVKVLHELASEDEQLLARFKREAEIACRLDHPHIVQVVDFNVESGSPYIVMELLKGESLAERLAHGATTGREATVLVRQVASALEAAHAESVVHRDLTPRNIFLCDEEVTGPDGVPFRVKVLDFGISKVLGGNTVRTAESAVMGTPAYMSPEQARGEQSAIGPRTDQFALGVVLYEALAGMRPFDGDSVPSVLYRVVHEPQDPLSDLVIHDDVSDAMVAAVERAMAKSPEDRFPSVTDFAHAFTGFGPPAATDVTMPAHDAGLGVAMTVQPSRPEPRTIEKNAAPPVSGVDKTLGRPSGDTSPAGLDTGLEHGSDLDATRSTPWGRWLAVAAVALGLGGLGYALGTSTGEGAKGGRPALSKAAASDADTAASHADGAASPVAAASEVVSPGPKAMVLADAASANVGGQGEVAATSDSTTPDAAAPSVTPATKRPRVAEATPSPPGPKKKSTPSKPDPVSGFASRSGEVSEAQGVDTRPKPRTDKAADGEAARLLNEAKTALAAKQAKKAEHLARRSYSEKRSSAAAVVVVKAKCMQRDSTGAAGWARRLGKRQRKAMKKHCLERYGMQLPML